MKRFLLLIIVLVAAFKVEAQSGYNYQELGIGTTLSDVQGATKIPLEYNHAAFSINLIYNYSPYLPIEAEIQFGTLSGGGLLPSQNPLGQQYINHYKAFILHADFQFGGFVDYSHSQFLYMIKDFYVGTGFGLVSNSLTVQRSSIYNPGTIFPGQDKNVSFTVPLRFGYEFKIFDSYIEPSVAIDVCYVQNIVFGSLDGYDDPGSNRYHQFTVGFKYYFGNVTSYKKLIRDLKE